MLYEGGRLRPPLVSLGPGFSAERVITSRRKNGEEGWKEKGRQEALVPVQEAVLSGRLLCSHHTIPHAHALHDIPLIDRVDDFDP